MMSVRVSYSVKEADAVDELDNAIELLLTTTMALQVRSDLLDQQAAEAIAGTVNAALAMVNRVRGALDRAQESAS